jgi:hypothetical protein
MTASWSGPPGDQPNTRSRRDLSRPMAGSPRFVCCVPCTMPRREFHVPRTTGLVPSANEDNRDEMLRRRRHRNAGRYGAGVEGPAKIPLDCERPHTSSYAGIGTRHRACIRLLRSRARLKECALSLSECAPAVRYDVKKRAPGMPLNLAPERTSLRVATRRRRRPGQQEQSDPGSAGRSLGSDPAHPVPVRPTPADGWIGCSRPSGCRRSCSRRPAGPQRLIEDR